MAEVSEGSGTTKFVILDGFILYVDEQLRNTIDVKFFLTAPYQVLKDRRESRKGYATLEGNTRISIAKELLSFCIVDMNGITNKSSRDG